MATIQKPVGRKQAVRLSVFLLLFVGWFATAALGACLPHAPGSHADHSHGHVPGLSGPDATGFGDANDECCITSLDSSYHPVLIKRSTLAEVEPATLPDVCVASFIAPTPGVGVVSSDTGAEFDHPPFYLLYSRLLIPWFS